MSMPIIVPGKTTRIEAVADIMESVALQETGLSHILNAEGEKIQAVVAMQGVTPDMLLAVNASVDETVSAITRLEILLTSKLNEFSCYISA
ncbi:MAG: hypothetical protein RR922_05085 [Clostridia bacterium]